MINKLERDVDVNDFQFKNLLTYTSEEVMGCNLTSFFARGSSSKETININ